VKVQQYVDKLFDRLLSPAIRHRGERLILTVAIISYLLHLALILFARLQVHPLDNIFLTNPVAAVYTPFSFILVYEVYLLIYFLPQSISSYIGKQYEIITLIVIRRIFKDIANLELSTDWFRDSGDLQFTYDVVTSVILFAMIFLYHRVSKKGNVRVERTVEEEQSIRSFIQLKKGLAVLLVPLLVLLAAYSFLMWAITTVANRELALSSLKSLNNIFFDEFFTVLIVVDVLLLLASLYHSDRFHEIMRNSGFVISTILIKISFSVTGLVNNALIVGAVVFGFLILLIHNQFVRQAGQREIW
jgi:hypothetical protein